MVRGISRLRSSGISTPGDSSIHRIVQMAVSLYSLRVPQEAGGRELSLGSVPP